jgi:uncharacterized membrane protein (UPF0127 family)
MAKLTIEVADTPAALAHGLMYRKDLPPDEGMLFKFPSTREANFWGKNTYIPLDIAFIDKDNRIMEIKEITPMSTRIVRSDGLCAMALETNAGFFDSNGVSVGQKIDLSENTIEFKEC